MRENVPELGNLSLEFDFAQDPIPPLILDPWPNWPRPAETDG